STTWCGSTTLRRVLEPSCTTWSVPRASRRRRCARHSSKRRAAHEATSACDVDAVLWPLEVARRQAAARYRRTVPARAVYQVARQLRAGQQADLQHGARRPREEERQVARHDLGELVLPAYQTLTTRQRRAFARERRRPGSRRLAAGEAADRVQPRP